MIKKVNTKQLEEQIVNLENQLKRAVADYQNLEKRVDETSFVVIDYAKGHLITRILPVLDSLDQAVEGATEAEANSSWLKGIMMSIKAFRQVLAEEGLAEIPTDDGFDPKLHEAVDVSQGEDDKILKVVLRGYTLNEKVVRPAKVVVGKKNPVTISEEAKKEVTTEES